MDQTVRDRIAQAAGARAVTAHGVVTPHTADAVAAVVRVCAETGTRIQVRSAAAHAAAAAAAGVVALNLHRIDAVEASPAALTLRAGAGATIDSVTAKAAESRLGVVGARESLGAAHVGGVVARGELPRRSLCGVEAVLASGEVVRFGGGVLKDVVGYDLPTLLLGSMGRLAIILAVTFRLEPVAARTPVNAPPGAAGDAAHALVAAAFDPQGLLQPAT